MTSKRWAGLVAAGVSGALLAGAGVAGSAPAGTSTTSGETARAHITLDQKKAVRRTNLSIRANPTQLLYNKKRMVARKGVVRITMRNPSNARHNIAIRGPKLKKARFGKIVRKGGISRVQANLRKGRYTFFCSVPGHEQAGMVGTLIVR